MWKSRLVISNSKVITKCRYKNELRFSSYSTKNKKNVAIGIISAGGFALIGSIVYAEYDPRLKEFLKKNIPFINRIDKLFLGDKAKETESKEIHLSDGMQTDSDKGDASNSVKEKIHTEKLSISDITNVALVKLKKYITRNVYSVDNEHVDEIKIMVTEPNVTESTSKTETEKNISAYEDALVKTVLKVKHSLAEATNAYRFAANYIKFYTRKLTETNAYSGYDIEIVSKEVINDWRAKEKILNFARKKTAEVKTSFENLKRDAKRLSELDDSHSLVVNAENLSSKCLSEFNKTEDEMKATEAYLEENEAREVAEFEKMLFVIKELFEKELEVFLSYKFQDNVEDDLNVLVTLALNRIEQLEQQIHRLQESEKQRIDKAMRDETMLDELDAEKCACLSELDTIIGNRLISLKVDFEGELHKLIIRQASDHAEYLRRSLELQENELNRKHKLELDEKLLDQKAGFVLENSENIARLKGIGEYLRRMNDCNKSTEKVKALWLLCQALSHKITYDSLNPFANDFEKIKTLVGKENDFVHTVINSVPAIALNRGVFTLEILKQRFEKVKKTCQKVALIDENNDSLYQYFLSYLQSFLIIDAKPTKEVFYNEVDEDTSKLDSLDILQRITFLLKTGNLKKSLHYAKQLKGESRFVAEDWINELTHLLETQLALKALLAYAAAISIQAYY